MLNSVLQKHFGYITALAVLLLMAVSIPVFADNHEATTETEETSEGQIQWVDTVEEATKLSTETGKPIMMDFYTEW